MATILPPSFNWDDILSVTSSIPPCMKITSYGAWLGAPSCKGPLSTMTLSIPCSVRAVCISLAGLSSLSKATTASARCAMIAAEYPKAEPTSKTSSLSLTSTRSSIFANVRGSKITLSFPIRICSPTYAVSLFSDGTKTSRFIDKKASIIGNFVTSDGRI